MQIGGEKGFLPYKQVVELIDSAMKGYIFKFNYLNDL